VTPASRRLHVSTENSAFQVLESLVSNRVKRHRSRTFVLEGVQPITRALAHGWTFEAVIHESGAPLSDWATDVVARADAAIRYEMTPELLGRLSGKTDTSELLAVVRMRDESFAQIPIHERLLAVVMDRPGNPGNLGTLIRTCDALGASGLVVTGHAVDLYDPATITASRGSIFALPVVQAASHAEVLQWVASVRERLGRCDLVGTDERAETDLAAHDFTAPTVLVVGNETHGLSRAYRDACDAVVRIPMSGSASSLNVSVAASIAVYEVVRQRASVENSRGDRPARLPSPA
jgi:TrmH family RNA methyltransferase